MGQQQLLLLVLATVIVGLATVAGIQAFDENQTQAAQDALVQRGTSIASDIKSLQSKPEQLGGIDLTQTAANFSTTAPQVLNRLGYENGKGSLSKSQVPVDGAPGGGNCDLSLNLGSNPGATLTCNAEEATQEVEVTLRTNPSSGNDPIKTTFN